MSLRNETSTANDSGIRMIIDAYLVVLNLVKDYCEVKNDNDNTTIMNTKPKTNSSATTTSFLTSSSSTFTKPLNNFHRNAKIVAAQEKQMGIEDKGIIKNDQNDTNHHHHHHQTLCVPTGSHIAKRRKVAWASTEI